MPFVGYALFITWSPSTIRKRGVIIGSFPSINAAFLAGVGGTPSSRQKLSRPLYNLMDWVSQCLLCWVSPPWLHELGREAFFTVVISPFFVNSCSTWNCTHKYSQPGHLLKKNSLGTPCFDGRPLGLSQMGQLLVNGLLKNWVACFMAKVPTGIKMDSLLKPCSVITHSGTKIAIVYPISHAYILIFLYHPVKSFDQRKKTSHA